MTLIVTIMSDDNNKEILILIIMIIIIKGKGSRSLIAVGAVGVRVPLYLGHN